MILTPVGPILNTVLEGENLNIVFSGNYKTIEIELLDFPKSVKTINNTIVGKFEYIFSMPENGLKYRIGLNYGMATQFNELPNNANLYSYSAPIGRIRNYNFKVTVTYINEELPGVEQTEVFNYVLPVEINYDLYSQALKELLWQQ